MSFTQVISIIFRLKSEVDSASLRVIERREALHTLLNGLGLAILSSCKTKKKDETVDIVPSEDISTDENSSPADLGQEGLDKNTNPLEGSQQDCRAEANYLDWKLIPDSEENLEIKYKFYGDSTSAMMVIGFPKYQHGNLREIFLVRPSGKLLAQKGISPTADVNRDTTLRLIVFDNIQIKDDQQLIVLFKTACRTCIGGIEFYKHKMKYRISFSDSFNGKKAFGLSPTSVPGQFGNYQATPRFRPDTLDSDGFASHGLSGFKALSSAQFVSSPNLKGVIVTDLLGRLITYDGSQFNEIITYPEFLCYRLVNNEYYIRTMIRVA